MSDDRVTVLLVDDIRLDPRELATDLAKVFGISPIELRMLLRRSRGVVLDRATPEQARRLSTVLEDHGIDTIVVPRKHLPTLPKPTKVTTFERSGELLMFRGEDPREAGAIAWKDIHVAVATPVGLEGYDRAIDRVRFRGVPNITTFDDDEARELIRENLILAVGGSQQPGDNEDQQRERRRKGQALIDTIEKKHSTKVKVYLDIIPMDLSIWIRASMTESSYRLSDEGARMGSAMGMRHLLNDIQSLSVRARIAPSLPALLEPVELTKVILADVEELGNYTTWLANVAWLDRQRDGDEEIESVSFDEDPS